MNRQSMAIFLAGGLLATFVFVAWRLPVPYVMFTPGPTVNVLGQAEDGQIIEISGAKQYVDGGTLRMTTVGVTAPETRLTLIEALDAWFDPGAAVLPREAVYAEDTDNENEDTRSSLEMVSSQDAAIAAALDALGYDFDVKVAVFGVSQGGPSDGILEPRDLIVKVGGQAIRKPRQVVRVVSALEPGEEVSVVVIRHGKRITKVITVGERPDEKGAPYLGVYPGFGYDFPVDVTINVDENIGGPSAGLIFSLAIYDNLTPGSLTGDVPVAGTGTIDPSGRVGPIGGIAQKIRGASMDGALLFLVPPANCAAALAAHPVNDLRLVKAPTMTSALRSIKAFVRDPDAELPRCE